MEWIFRMTERLGRFLYEWLVELQHCDGSHKWCSRSNTPLHPQLPLWRCSGTHHYRCPCMWICWTGHWLCCYQLVSTSEYLQLSAGTMKWSSFHYPSCRESVPTLTFKIFSWVRCTMASNPAKTQESQIYKRVILNSFQREFPLVLPTSVDFIAIQLYDHFYRLVSVHLCSI